MIHSSKFAGVCRLHEEAPAKKCVNRCRISLWLVLPFWQTYLSIYIRSRNEEAKQSVFQQNRFFISLASKCPPTGTHPAQEGFQKLPHSDSSVLVVWGRNFQRTQHSQSLRTKRTCWKKRPLFWAALAGVTKPCQVDQNHEIRHATCSKWENHRTK